VKTAQKARKLLLSENWSDERWEYGGGKAATSAPIAQRGNQHSIVITYVVLVI
jgi:hypothetical protein